MATVTKAAAEKAAKTEAEATTGQSADLAQITAANAVSGESGAAVTPESDSAPESGESAELSATVDVVVRAKRSVKHEGQHHPETSVLNMLRNDAERLHRIGFVDYLDDLHKAAQAIYASQGVSVTVNSGVEITKES